MSSRKNELLLETKYKTLDNIIMGIDEKEDESLGSSQNFCLKLSQDSAISDNQDTNNDEDIIVISDSSSTCSTPKDASQSSSVSKKHPLINSNVFIVDSSDSGSSNTENQKYFQKWRAEAKSHFIDNYQNDILKENNISYTSDESSCNSIEHIKYVQNITSSNKTSSSYITCTTGNIKSKEIVNSHGNIYNEGNLLSNYPINSSRSNSKSSKTPNNSTCKSFNSSKSKSSNDNTSKSSNSNKSKNSNNNFKNYLSRKDMKNIIKNIKSKQMVYESPKIRQKNVEADKDADDDIHCAISSGTNVKQSDVIINETVDSESEIIPASQTNITNLYKTHISKYFNGQDLEKNIETTCTELSERKKKQILQWLMVNSPDSQSDSSFSIVSTSNKDGKSSGNSSLERLEMNYETPNNRERIRQQHTIEKGIKTTGCDKIPLSTPLRQPAINEFVQRTEDNVSVHSKLTKGCAKNNMFSTSTNPTTNVPQNIDITDCADILDKLYGKSWRDKADTLFPKTEPRKVVPTKNRAVQTERKITRRGGFNISDSDDSNTSMKELNLQNEGSRKKVVQRSVKRRDSFINDQTSSESGCESSYHTALTNLRTSPNNLRTKQKMPSIVQQLGVLCDGESEDEYYESNNNQNLDIGRRKLSFNNSGSEDSSTSEFDPDDEVPPKPIVKKDSTKNARQMYKLSTPTNVKYNKLKSEKHNSFLASLSESVPIANVHPEAKKYRLDYKNNKENLCNYLYKLYNEKVFDNELPEDMNIEWNVRMRGTAGYCYNKKSVKTIGGIVRSSRIVLATKILDTPDRLRDTLIHEMCHAAAWLINGVSDGHGPFWTTWASKAMKIFPELPPVRRCHDYKIKTKFTYKCVSCGYSIGRHSKSLDIEKKRCGHCYGKFELLINKTTKSGIVQMQTPKREPSAFALYVKENYNTVKKDRNVRHAEVMKILGQQFSAMKIAKRKENINNNSDNPD
ncbi:uncharacterized protein LOC143428848 [Xylocopa sonorina]|uniref:uncharacterized protein LOC143428848 n=1 Tax=Xylocopa sonorina TaxID=1818115 RepID=UPI00403AF47B